jgi:TM2 domain-containing membrane protein YozV
MICLNLYWYNKAYNLLFTSIRIELMSQQGSAGNVIAAIASFFFPGLGQLVQGRILAALVFCIVVIVGYAMWWLIFPAIIGAIAHLWSIIDAAKYRAD